MLSLLFPYYIFRKVCQIFLLLSGDERRVGVSHKTELDRACGDDSRRKQKSRKKSETKCGEYENRKSAVVV